MKNSATAAAIKFIKKDIRKKVDFNSISAYLQKRGFAIIFYDPDTGHKLLDELKLSDYAKSVQAFTVQSDISRFIFIQSNVPSEDKLYLLLHETGHIVLKHLNSNMLVVNTRWHDIEADAFAYTALKPPKKNYTVLALWTLIIALIIGSLLSNHSQPDSIPVTGSNVEYVLITPSGKKYHRESCIYVKNKNCSTITKEEAENTHAPCLVCNP